MRSNHRRVAMPATPVAARARHESGPARVGPAQSAIWKRVARGALFRRYHGVYSLSPGELSREGEWTAALLAAGEGATLSDLLRRGPWRRRGGIPRTRSTSRSPRRHVPIPGVRLHQRRLDPLRRAASATASGSRPWRGRASTSSDVPGRPRRPTKSSTGRRSASASTSMRRGGPWPRADREPVACSSRRSSDCSAAAPGSRAATSAPSSLPRTRAGLPRPTHDCHVLDHPRSTSTGRRQRLVVDVDGGAALHARRPRLDDDRRDAELAAAGWTTLRFRPAEIEHRPERVLAAVGCALARPAHLSGVSPRDRRDNRFVSAYSVVPL